MSKNKTSLKNIGRDYCIENLEDKLFDRAEDKSKYRHRHRKAKDGLYEENMGKHDSSIRAIKDDACLIGINNLFYHAHTDEDFFCGHIKKGSVDVYLEIPGEKIAVEYKCNDTINNRSYAKIQLRRAERFLKVNQGIRLTKLLYTHGSDFKTDELTDNGWKPFNYTL